MFPHLVDRTVKSGQETGWEWGLDLILGPMCEAGHVDTPSDCARASQKFVICGMLPSMTATSQCHGKFPTFHP